MFDETEHERLCEETFRARDAAWSEGAANIAAASTRVSA